MLHYRDVASLFGVSPMNTGQNDQHAANVKRKWTLLWITFIGIMLLGLSWTGLQEKQYQTEATIALGRDAYTLGTNNIKLLEQFGRIKQKIVKRTLLEQVRADLTERFSYNTSIAELQSSITVLPDLASRSIKVQVVGNEPNQIQDTLNVLLDAFFVVHEDDIQKNSVADVATLETEIEQLGLQIEEKQKELSTLAQDNRIVSEERDENQIIALLKSSNEKLNLAIDRVDQSEDIIAKIRLSKEYGAPLLHPDDIESVAQIDLSIRELQSELADLSEKYTQAYLALDPDIVEKQKRLSRLKAKKETIASGSAERLQNESRVQLAINKEMVETLKARIDEINAEARDFNFKLQTFNRLSENANQLESQRAFLQQQLADSIKNAELKLVVSEPPFLPDSSIGPNYILFVLYTFIAAIIASIGAVVLFSYVTRESASTAVNNLTVVPGAAQPQPTQSLQNSEYLIEQQRQALPEHSQTPTQQPAQLEAPNAIVVLSQRDMQQLYDASNRLTKSLILLALCGVSEDEITGLDNSVLNTETCLLNVPGEHGRVLSLADYSDSAITQLAQQLPKLSSLSTADIQHSLVNSAVDIGLVDADQMSYQRLRQTFMVFLVEHGVKLNQLEDFIGYAPSHVLASMRQYVSGRATLESMNLVYPLST